jgi:hypothetical protein
VRSRPTCSRAASESGAALPPTGVEEARIIFFTRGTPAAGVVLSHRRTGCGRSSATSAGGGGVVCMFPLFHMAGWTIALGLAEAPADPLRARA